MTTGLVAVLSMVLGGCGGSEEPASQSAPAKAGPTASAAASAAPGAGAAAAQPVAAPAPTAAPADLANFSCTRRHGVWSAHGDVSNSTRDPMVYTVTVVTISGTDVAGEDTSRFLLRPGGTTSFDLPAVSTGPADECMPRLVRQPR
jgi:hypothetical protein